MQRPFWKKSWALSRWLRTTSRQAKKADKRRTGSRFCGYVEALEDRRMMTAYYLSTSVSNPLWDDVTSIWSTTPGGSPTHVWNNSAGDTAIIPSGISSVAISGQIFASSVEFQGSGTVLASNTSSDTLAVSTITVDSGSDSVSANLVGTSSLTVDGSGSVNLSGSNTYTGWTTINGGVQLGSSTALGTSGNVSVANGATLDLNGYSTTVSRLSGYGTIEDTSQTSSVRQ